MTAVGGVEQCKDCTCPANYSAPAGSKSFNSDCKPCSAPQVSEGGASQCHDPFMYACNITAGMCIVQPDGTQTQSECAGSCHARCPPNNCGQLNGTTWTCQGKTGKFGGCNVCDECCQQYLKHQIDCDGCFGTKPPGGCGGKPASP